MVAIQQSRTVVLNCSHPASPSTVPTLRLQRHKDVKSYGCIDLPQRFT